MFAGKFGRLLVVVVGAVALGGAGVAFAEETVGPNDDTGSGPGGVPVNGWIRIPACTDGELSMTVDDSDIEFTEDTTSTGIPAGERWFDGMLVDVTVDDTRCQDIVPDGVSWWVEGQATDFVAQDGQPSDIPGSHLGWAPNMTVNPTPLLVFAGDEVSSSLDSGTADPSWPGGTEVMYYVDPATGSGDAEIVAENKWSAEAQLKVKTDVELFEGAYKSVLTLTLFEY